MLYNKQYFNVSLLREKGFEGRGLWQNLGETLFKSFVSS